jgi:hypothetical protein
MITRPVRHLHIITTLSSDIAYPPSISAVKNTHAVSAYSIRDGSTITLIGSATPLPNERTSHKHSTNNESERSTVTRIQSELQEVRNSLLLDVDTFLRILDVSRHENPHSAKALEMEHNRLEELLLQTLLRLDAINSEGTWEGARAERKGAVKEVQALLDRLDEGWNQRSK